VHLTIGAARSFHIHAIDGAPQAEGRGHREWGQGARPVSWPFGVRQAERAAWEANSHGLKTAARPPLASLEKAVLLAPMLQSAPLAVGGCVHGRDPSNDLASEHPERQSACS